MQLILFRQLSRKTTIEELVLRLHNLSSITTTLKSDSASIANLQSLFDAIISEYAEAGKSLTSDSSIVHDIDVEQAICKVTSGNGLALSTDDRNSFCHLQTPSVCALEDCYEERLSLAERDLKSECADAAADSAVA